MRGILHSEDFGWASAPRGKGGGGTNTSTTVQNTTPPPAFTQALQGALTQGQNAASAPFTQYPGQLQAPFAPQQLQGFGMVGSTPGIAAPYVNAAAQHYDAATNPLWQNVQQFSPQAISQYSNPYTQNVINATQAHFNDQNAQAANRLQGDAASRGALGGDRAGVAQAVLQGQEDFAQAPVIAGLQNQGYAQALQEFNQQQGTQLGADQANAWLNSQAAAGFGGLGTEALNTTLGSANALMGAGAQQQAQAQQGLNIPFAQFQAQQAYPFQTAGWLSGLTSQLANAAGGTASTTSPGPSPFSQGVGALTAGAGAIGALNKAGVFNSTPSTGFGSPGIGDINSTILPSEQAAADAAGGFGAGASNIGDFIPGGARGGAIPHRAPGGMVPGNDPMGMGNPGGAPPGIAPGLGAGVPMGFNGGVPMGGDTLAGMGVPDVSVSVVPDAPPAGLPSGAKTSTSVTSGGGGGKDSIFGTLLKTAGNIAAGVFGGPAGGLAASALGSQVHFGHGGGVPNRAPGGSIAVPQMPSVAGGAGPVSVSSSPSSLTGFALPQMTVNAGGSGSGSPDEVNAFLDSVAKGQFHIPAKPAPTAAAPPPVAAPVTPPPPLIDPFFAEQAGQSNTGGAQSEGGGDQGGAQARGGPVHGFAMGGMPLRGFADAGAVTDDLTPDDTYDTEPGGPPRQTIANPHGLPTVSDPWDTSGGKAPSSMGNPPPASDSAKERFLQGVVTRESGNRNVPNQQGPGGTPLSSSSGYFQITDPTWRENARLAGVDTDKYPTAMSAPREVQHQVAGLLYDREGERPWAASAPGATGTAGLGNPPDLPPAPDRQVSDWTPAERKYGPDDIHMPAKPNGWLSLMEAGFGMMGGTSPFAAVNIGRGAEQGVRSYQNYDLAAQKLATNVEEARARISENQAYHDDTINTRRFGIDTRSADRQQQFANQMSIAQLRIQAQQAAAAARGAGHMTEAEAEQTRVQQLMLPTEQGGMGMTMPDAIEAAKGFAGRAARAGRTADQGDRRLDQGDARLQQGWQRLQQSADTAEANQQIRRDALTQARTEHEKTLLNTATNAEVSAAARMSFSADGFPAALEKVIAGRKTAAPASAAPATAAPPDPLGIR
jgi:hypothetical protein